MVLETVVTHLIFSSVARPLSITMKKGPMVPLGYPVPLVTGIVSVEESMPADRVVGAAVPE
jgi:hypothetical protein